MATRQPPRFVPTLTEVVHGRTTAPEADVFLEDQITQRVMQRVELGLERKLREAIAAVVLEHTRGIVPALRTKIQSTVHEAVAQALAEEIAAHQQAESPKP